MQAPKRWASRPRDRRGSHGATLGRLALATAIASSFVMLFDGVADASPPAGRAMVAFVHATAGGAWSARQLGSLPAGGQPSVGSFAGRLVVAERTTQGHVVVAEGPATGPLATQDLTVVAGAPVASGRPAVSSGGAGLYVWFRSPLGDLIVAHQVAAAAPWSVTDVTQSIGGVSQLASDPVPVALGGRLGVIAIAQGGRLVRFDAPVGSSPWSASDPTNGLVLPPLQGTVAALPAPGAPAATVLVATTADGDLIECTDEIPGPFGAVGPWRAIDLTALGAPPTTALGTTHAPTPVVPYVSTWGDVVALSLTSGLPGGATWTDLTETAEAAPAPSALPAVVWSPQGAAVAVRTRAGDLTAFPVNVPTGVTDVSFEPGTGRLVASDVSSVVLGGAEVIVGADAGPIAPTGLATRIAVLAASFDQQHARLQTTPSGSDCNPFTAAFGRGSSWGCRHGTAAEAWCSDFAQWVWQTAGVQTAGISGWSASFATWGAAHHRVQFGTHFTARVGDAIVWGTRSPLYGTHVGIIVSVVGTQIDVVSGNSGGDFPGYEEGVWRSGLFTGASSTVSGYHVLAVVDP